MKREIQRYKKAAISLRTFSDVVRKNADFFNINGNEEYASKRRKFHEDIASLRKQLDDSIGHDVLRELYWEGKVK